MEACRATACSGSCLPQCGDTPVLVPPSSASACASCISTQCCNLSAACAQDADCLATYECLGANDSPDGWAACTQTLFPRGLNDYEGLESCILSACPDDCAYGRNWSCVGHVSWPPAPGPTVTATIQATDALNQNQGVPGMDAKLCYFTDTSCANPIDEKTTDKNGDVTFEGPAQNQSGRTGFDGFLLLSDPNYAATDPNRYLPALLHAFPPLTASNVVRQVIMATNGTLDQLAGLVNLKLDPSRGMAVLSVSDCVGRRAPGISFKVTPADPVTQILYLKGTFVDRYATATDKLGDALIANLPVGPFTVTATSPDAGQVAVVPAYARANTVSLVVVPPTP